MTDQIVPPHPRTVAFWVARIFLAAVIVFGGWSAWRVSRKTIDESTESLLHATDSPPNTEAGRAALMADLATKRADVAALDSQIAATKEALDRLEKRKKPTFSFGSGEQAEFDRLNEETRQLELRRAKAAAELATAEAKR